MKGQEITDVREAMGMLQPEFAVRLGIHPVTLSRFENDRDPIPLYIELAIPELERRLKAEGYPLPDARPIRKKKPARAKKPKPKK